MAHSGEREIEGGDGRDKREWSVPPESLQGSSGRLPGRGDQEEGSHRVLFVYIFMYIQYQT